MNEEIRVKVLQDALKRSCKLASKYNAISYWLEREINKYKAKQVFSSWAIRDCGWKLRVMPSNIDATFEGRVHDAILRYFPDDGFYHSTICLDDLRLSMDDNDLYLSGPIDSLRAYAESNKLVIDLGDINKVIDANSVTQMHLINLRDAFK